MTRLGVQGVLHPIGIKCHARGDDGIEGFDRVRHGDGEPCAGGEGRQTRPFFSNQESNIFRPLKRGQTLTLRIEGHPRGRFRQIPDRRTLHQGHLEHRSAGCPDRFGVIGMGRFFEQDDPFDAHGHRRPNQGPHVRRISERAQEFKALRSSLEVRRGKGRGLADQERRPRAKEIDLLEERCGQGIGCDVGRNRERHGYPGAVDEFETLRGMLHQGFPNDFFPRDEALLKPFDPASVV